MSQRDQEKGAVPENSEGSDEIRIVIADDHEVVREGLRSLLDVPGIRVVGQAADGREAIREVGRLEPDLVILDIRMPGMDGLEALKAIKSGWPRTSVLIFTQFEDADYMERAILNGAAGYILKGTPGKEILKTVVGIAHGHLGPDLPALRFFWTRMHREARGGAPPPPGKPSSVFALTPQEKAVLRCLAEAFTNQEIADCLGIQVSTVKSHLLSLRDKLNVSDRTQAAVWAVRHGYLDEE